MSDPIQTISGLLLYLARNADPKRFFPFPNEFRIETKKVPPSEDPFEKYTVHEFIKMYTILKSLPHDDNPKVAQKKLSETQTILMNYICNISLNMSLHEKSIHPDIIEYQFKYSAMHERLLDNKYKKRWYLFHGSKVGNWHSILRNGIKSMSGTEYMSAGAALGNGVYLTNSLDMAAGYGLGAKFACVAVVEVLEDIEPYSKKTGVYVIPKDEILIPRYLYIVKNAGALAYKDANNILDYYKKSKEAMLAPMIEQSQRSKNEIARLANCVEILQNDFPMLMIIIKGILFNIVIEGFPFTFPIIKLVYQIFPPVDQFHPKTGLYIGKTFTDEWKPMIHLTDIVKELELLIENSAMTDTACADI